MIKSRLRLAAAALLCAPMLLGQPALAADFTADAASTWTARSLRMADIKGDMSEASIKANMISVCDGLQAEQVAHEYGKEPTWALSSQLTLCTAYARWGGHSFGATKRPCDDTQKTITDLAKAKKGEVSDEVLAAAQALSATASSLLASAKSEKHACSF